MTKIGAKHRKVRVLDVVYNASNNELLRTKTFVKGAIVLVDAHPFKEWYETITVSRLVSRRERMLRRRRLSSSPIASCARLLPGRRDVVLLSLLLITSLRVGVFMPRLLLVLDKVEGVMEFMFVKDLDLFSTRR
jgi:ribosomal protein S8E